MPVKTNRSCEDKVDGIEDREAENHLPRHKLGLGPVRDNECTNQTNRAASRQYIRLSPAYG